MPQSFGIDETDRSDAMPFAPFDISSREEIAAIRYSLFTISDNRPIREEKKIIYELTIRDEIPADLMDSTKLNDCREIISVFCEIEIFDLKIRPTIMAEITVEI